MDSTSPEAEIIDFLLRKEKEEKREPLAWLDMSQWDHEEVPDREWTIRERVPARQAGLFSGEGGTGKSIIELTKNVAHVTGKDWLGSLPELEAGIHLVSEDDNNEVHIRLAAITGHYNVTFKEVVDGGLHVLPLLGQDATLCAPARNGLIQTTALYKQIYEAAGDIKPKNISIDTLSRAYAGSEIDRAQVYQFATHMQALALVSGGSVTVLSHPSLSGIASGSGLSGSTGWQGAFRFHQYLRGIKSETETDNNNARELVFRKNQYGPLGETIMLRYQRGLFLPQARASSFEKLARESKCDEVFMHLLRRHTGQGRNVSDKKTAPNYAPAMFVEEAEAKKDAIRKPELTDAMRRLFAANKIYVESYGKASQLHSRIAVKI